MSRKPNTPYTLGTSNRMRNIIIAIVIACLIGVGVFYVFYQEGPANGLDPMQVPEIVPKTDNETMNTPQRASEAINAYYTALAAQDAGQLMNIGASVAASAINNEWLKAMDYSADASKLACAYRDEFPPAAGIWAGNTLYNITDFYAIVPENAIRNNVTGLTGPVGWVYFDSVQGHWVVADPTIPTATNAAQFNSVEKASSDKLVTVHVQSVGALANPWWCYAQIGISISSTNQNSEVTLAPREFDEGITLNIPPNLAQTIPKAVVVQDTNGSTAVSKITPQKLNGVCIVFRGTTSDFAINKIGSPPLTMDGDMMPLSIHTSTENITPIFAIGDSTVESIQQTLTQEEIDRYNATNADLPAVPKITVELPNGANVNASTNPNAARR